LHGRGSLKNLLAMPVTPVEVMLGKIIPYVLVGFVQAALIIGRGVGIFGVPVFGSIFLLAALSTLFITANLSTGYTFSTIAQNQLQAMQMSMMFVFAQHSAFRLHVSVRRNAGMGARWIGEGPPLTHCCASCAPSCSKAQALPTCAMTHLCSRA
jgi:ABC-2 type transport system permease protein